MVARIRHLSWAVRLLVLAILISVPALAALDSVGDLFQAARYEEARLALEQNEEGFRAGEATLWQVRLATEPNAALVMLREGLADGRLPAEVKTRMALEIADIEFGLGHYQSSLKVLASLIDDDPGSLPGDVYLRAGLALRALGHPQKAREMLASVRPRDQAFLLARYYLGDIALDQRDPALALRYFDSASGGEGSTALPRVAGGMWRAYIAENRDQEASDLEQELERLDSGSLAMLEIRRLRLEMDEELAAMTSADSTSTAEPTGQTSQGRYALQLGAFSDRGLALEFLRRYRGQLPDLRIDEVLDKRGQFMYKIRTGSFVNPALARTEAGNLARRLNMEVIVADLSDTADRND